VVSFLLLGIEEVAGELENLFGYNVNDLPVDDLCRTIQSNVEQITQLNQTPMEKPMAITN
jgi:putative membrane protein